MASAGHSMSHLLESRKAVKPSNLA